MEPNENWKAKKSRKDEIFEEFPKDLMEDVIARLPTAVFFRFRSVCREWNSLLGSRNFLQRVAEVPRQNKPWLYCTACRDDKVNTGAMYDTYTNKWHPYPACTRFLYPSASAGGLVCHNDLSRKSNCFVVGNPITQTWTKFPAAPNLRYWTPAVGMAMCSGGYKIVTVDRWDVFAVYKSPPTPRLSTTGQIPDGTKLNLVPRSDHRSQQCTPPVTIGTVVYFLTSEPNGILSYDVVGGVWEQVHIPAPPGSNGLHLGACGGRVLLIGLVGVVCCVWELQRERLEWMEVDRMPSSWCSDLARRSRVELRCFGNTGVCMVVLQGIKMNRTFMYDMVSREWSKVPRFTLPGCSSRLRTDCGVVFYPSLSAVP